MHFINELWIWCTKRCFIARRTYAPSLCQLRCIFAQYLVNLVALKGVFHTRRTYKSSLFFIWLRNTQWKYLNYINVFKMRVLLALFFIAMWLAPLLAVDCQRGSKMYLNFLVTSWSDKYAPWEVSSDKRLGDFWNKAWLAFVQFSLHLGFR